MKEKWRSNILTFLNNFFLYVTNEIVLLLCPANCRITSKILLFRKQFIASYTRVGYWNFTSRLRFTIDHTGKACLLGGISLSYTSTGIQWIILLFYFTSYLTCLVIISLWIWKYLNKLYNSVYQWVSFLPLYIAVEQLRMKDSLTSPITSTQVYFFLGGVPDSSNIFLRVSPKDLILFQCLDMENIVNISLTTIISLT